VLKWEIDLTKTPILHWPWRVDCIYPGLDEETKAGNDYPARIYMIHNGGCLEWRSRAIDYVWSSSQPVHKAWPNAFVIQVMDGSGSFGPTGAARRAVVYAMAQRARGLQAILRSEARPYRRRGTHDRLRQQQAQGDGVLR
jgi:hypothetical protein